MTDKTAERTRAQAVELFRELGLTEYEARVYVALLRLGTARARDISETADVPRTRVYDAIDRLTERGFVDAQESSPKAFQPVSRETVMWKLQLDYETALSRLSDELTDLLPADRQHDQPGVWSVTGRKAVAERVREFVADAEEEVVYLTDEDLLTEAVVEALAAADQRGVDIRLGGGSPATRDRIRTAIPSVELFEPVWEFADTPAGRLVMVDRDTILVSAVTDGGAPEETAIWGSGERNSLLVVLKTIFLWQLTHSKTDADD